MEIVIPLRAVGARSACGVAFQQRRVVRVVLEHEVQRTVCREPMDGGRELAQEVWIRVVEDRVHGVEP